MASDRVIIIRIAGVGLSTASATLPLTLTSRALPYITSADGIVGVVTELSTQFSSEIPLFGTLGSDPTTTFSVLANTQTLSTLMARGATPIRDANNGSVQTTAYITPSPTPTILVTDAGLINIGDRFRINGCAYEVTFSDNAAPGILSCEMRHGSSPQPVPVRSIGEEVVGPTLYAEYYQSTDYPTGGIEQQPITISTNSIDAPDETTEEVIFRGLVSRVSIETSAGTDNQIRVECMSLMGIIKNAPWAPAPTGIYFVGRPGYDRYPENDLGNTRNLNGTLNTSPNRNLQGPIWEASQTPYDTRYGTMQIRTEKFGGVTNIIEATAGTITIAARPVDPGLDDLRAQGFNLMFNDGYYRPYSSANDDDVNIALSEGSLGRIRQRRRDNDNRQITLQIDPAFQVEIAFSSPTITGGIIDLIFGTFDTDSSGSFGVRPWGMAAWIPFDISSLTDIIDLGSLLAAVSQEQMQSDLPTMNGWDWTVPVELPNIVVLPVKPDGPKTIGEVLENFLKNLGVFMVYDRGRLTFGRWASENPWPIAVNDSDFAEPKVSLNYDRQNSIASVTVQYPATITADKLNLTANPIANVERIIVGGGKTMTIGSMMQQGADYQAGLISSFAFTNGTNIVTRYSQSAAIIEVTLRNATKTLRIGDFVAFSSAFIPNGAGSMGVSNATGIVLKAVRSWQTPTSSYTLFLPGYLYAANRVSTVSVSAKVVSVPMSGTVEVEYNAFTLPAGFGPNGSPTTDAEAFEQTLQRIVTSPKDYTCILCDEYGTLYGVSQRLTGTTGNNLQFAGAAMDVAVAGDIIMMDVASNVFSGDPDDMEQCWDAFQADSGGLVNADIAFSYPWVR
jgi:hypothetical protein